MSNKIAFVLASTDHGPMIVNRVDFQVPEGGGYIGVGTSLLGTGRYITDDELDLQMKMFALLRKYRGPGLNVIDGGANIGVFTLTWAKLLEGWGEVYAFEPQDRIFYALAGNIALNNCFNAHAKHAALGGPTQMFINVPHLNYSAAGNFGGLSLVNKNDIGQPVGDFTYVVPCVSIDSLQLPRVDFIKLDLEGMEISALVGAVKTITKHKPVLLIEHIKVGTPAIERVLPDYKFIPSNMDVLAIAKGDPIWNDLKINDTKGAA